MFVIEDKIMRYPNMTILEDLLTRDGPPTEDSFTPYSGYASRLKMQFKEDKNGLTVTVNDILENSLDFKASKARPNDDGVDREYSAKEALDNYHRRLEDIDSSFVYKYILQVIIGFKKNATGLKQLKSEVREVESFYDEEEEEYVSITDTLTKEEVFTPEEILEAREKLPYLLKQLHEGSKIYKGSLLSFLIASEKIKSSRNFDGSYKPRFLVQCGVYRVDKNGNPTYLFKIEDNTGNIFRDLVSWINTRGSSYKERSVYMRAGEELLRALEVLQIDITTEDCRWYTDEFISSIVCTHLPSNAEYLRTYGMSNKYLLSKYNVEKIMEISEIIEDEREAFSTKDEVSGFVEEAALIIRQLHMYGIWQSDPRGVKEFLEYYNANVQKCKTDLYRYDISRGILELADSGVFFVNIGKIYPRNKWAFLTISGRVVLLEYFKVTPFSTDVYSALRCFKEGDTCEFAETYLPD